MSREKRRASAEGDPAPDLPTDPTPPEPPAPVVSDVVEVLFEVADSCSAADNQGRRIRLMPGPLTVTLSRESREDLLARGLLRVRAVT